MNFERLSYDRRNSVPLADALRTLAPGTKYFVIEFIEVALATFIDVALPEPNHT